MKNSIVVTSAVDRLLHHAHVVATDGQSKRLADALEGKGGQVAGASRHGRALER